MQPRRLWAFPLVLTTCLLVAADDQDVKKETKKMQGKWVATSLRQGDAEVPKKELDQGKVTLVIDGDTFDFRTPKDHQKGTFRVDPSKKPRTMDLAVTAKGDKKDKTEKVLCIYEWDGETLRIAANQQRRPTDFESRVGGTIVARLKRAKGEK
jgi:uncharacterized protein (TIGR03067 family)